MAHQEVDLTDHPVVEMSEGNLASMNSEDVCRLIEMDPRRTLILIGENVCDATQYLGEHVCLRSTSSPPTC